MDKETVLNNIFDSDLFGILEIKAKNSVVTADDRLIASFQEINDFYDRHGNEPKRSVDMHERKLYARLEGLRTDVAKMESLRQYDRHNLLGIN